MYRQGDPGFLSNIWGAVKGAVVGYVTGGPAGAVVGAVGGYVGASSHPSAPSAPPAGGVGPVRLGPPNDPYGVSPTGYGQYAYPGGANTQQGFMAGNPAGGPWVVPAGAAGGRSAGLYARPRGHRVRYRRVCQRVPY